MFSRKTKMYFKMNWIRISVIAASALLVLSVIIGLVSLESFYRQMQLVQIPLWILMGVINAGVFVFMYLFMLRGGMTKIVAGSIKSEQVNVRWDNVIGIDEAKLEAWELVQLIKDRAFLQKIGGQVIRGVLMVGPPGCGKTYLAKAIATECGIPFLPISGSEFVEIFVGVGSSKVRKLFKKARMYAYGYGACIIFIDELDAVGLQRKLDVGFGGQEERNTTLNELLVQMDGLKSKEENVIVLGATNAPEKELDPALLRPGRFDRKIYIDQPTLEGRQKLFAYYLQKVKHDPSIDVGRLARKAVYKSPAEIENIIREAALITTRNKKELVSFDEISEAMERIDLGIKRKRNMTEHEKRLTAYHESGHLITMYLLHPTEDVFKASIVGRRETLGVVYGQPREELFTRSRDMLMADIKVSLGGYAAEKMKFGTTTTGVAADFEKAMTLAHTMVWKLGMGSKGNVGDYTMVSGEMRGAFLSEKMKEILDAQTQEIFQQCLQDVENLLRSEDKLLDRFADELIKKDELEYDDIEAVFKEYGKARK